MSLMYDYSIHASYYSQKSMQESMQGFVLSPPPSGYPLQLPSTLSPSHGTTISSNVGQSSGPYSFVKPRLQSSPLESEISVQSSKYNHFNFHHSPIPERAMDFDNVEVSDVCILSVEHDHLLSIIFSNIPGQCQC